MKCVQKSCQRNKNIDVQSGLCNVCHDVVKETTDKFKNKEARKVITKKVEVDFADMVRMHQKLSKGEVNDPTAVSGLILGGIINILAQHDQIEDLEAKIENLELENKTNKSRLEALENWISKQATEVLKLDTKLETLDKDGVVVKENSEFNSMKKKMISLEVDVLGMKSKHFSETQQSSVDRITQHVLPKKSCEFCASTFSRNCDLEKHVKEEHGSVQMNYKCEVCEKEFYLEWRYKKHEMVHKGNAKYCHYLKNSKSCHYEEIGCKFSHSDEPVGEQDGDVEDNHIDEATDGEECDAEDEFTLNENQCHLCKKQLSTKDELWDHVEKVHVEYFQGMLEYAAENRT